MLLTLGASALGGLVYRQLAEAVEELMEDGDSVWFRQPVSLKLVAGYTKRVFCPIDLSTMALRLRNLYYRSLHVRSSRGGGWWEASTQSFYAFLPFSAGRHLKRTYA